MAYANENNIILELNDNEKNDLIYKAIYKNNIEMVELFINYSINNNIFLVLNGENNFLEYPILSAIENNNITMIKKITHQICQ